MKCYVTFYFHAVLSSFSGWNTERLHEAWDVNSCLFALKLVVQRKEWSRPLCTCMQHITAQTREPELIAAARVSACVGFILHVSEASQKRLSKTFIQRSVTPHQRLSERLSWWNKYVYRTERPVPKIIGMNTCTDTPLLYTEYSFFYCLNCLICLFLRSVISYKTDKQPLFSVDTVANSGIVSLLDWIPIMTRITTSLDYCWNHIKHVREPSLFSNAWWHVVAFQTLLLLLLPLVIE